MSRLKSPPPLLAMLPAALPFPTRQEAEAARFVARDRNEPWRAWYRTARWQKLRLFVLTRDLWTCQQTGVLLIGKYPTDNSPVVDHIKPHRGDPVLFWDPFNLQALAKAYHDTTKQAEERAMRE
jgi:5-methylcytosine-specific restriction endonuclease McrA